MRNKYYAWFFYPKIDLPKDLQSNDSIGRQYNKSLSLQQQCLGRLSIELKSLINIFPFQ
jgi:hypothetical protein